jgi:hypothetical protein
MPRLNTRRSGVLEANSNGDSRVLHTSAEGGLTGGLQREGLQCERSARGTVQTVLRERRIRAQLKSGRVRGPRLAAVDLARVDGDPAAQVAAESEQGPAREHPDALQKSSVRRARQLLPGAAAAGAMPLQQAKPAFEIRPKPIQPHCQHSRNLSHPQ